MSRDQGVRPQLAVSLGWSIGLLARVGQPAVAATLVGALDAGALAGMGDFPGVASARARTLEHIRGVLGDEATDQGIALGAEMSYDDIVQYALEHLDRNARATSAEPFEFSFDRPRPATHPR